MAAGQLPTRPWSPSPGSRRLRSPTMPPAFNGALAALKSVVGHPAARSPEPREQRVPLQPRPALLSGHGRSTVLALLVLFVSWVWKPELLRPAAFSLLVAGAVVHTAGPGCAHHPPGPPAGHQPLLLRHLRGLGRGGARPGPGADVPQRLRHRRGRRRGLRLADRRPPSGHRGRHHGDDAGRAGHQLLAGHPRGDHHHRLLAARSWPAPSPSPTPSGHSSPSVDAETDKALVDMAYGIICFATLLQLRGHRAGRHLGRPVLGPLLGLGSQGERRPAHRALERPHPPRPLGRLRPRTRHSWPWPSSATSSPPAPGSA